MTEMFWDMLGLAAVAVAGGWAAGQFMRTLTDCCIRMCPDVIPAPEDDDDAAEVI